MVHGRVKESMNEGCLRVCLFACSRVCVFACLHGDIIESAHICSVDACCNGIRWNMCMSYESMFEALYTCMGRPISQVIASMDTCGQIPVD